MLRLYRCSEARAGDGRWRYWYWFFLTVYLHNIWVWRQEIFRHRRFWSEDFYLDELEILALTQYEIWTLYENEALKDTSAKKWPRRCAVCNTSIYLHLHLNFYIPSLTLEQIVGPHLCRVSTCIACSQIFSIFRKCV